MAREEIGKVERSYHREPHKELVLHPSQEEPLKGFKGLKQGETCIDYLQGGWIHGR